MPIHFSRPDGSCASPAEGDKNSFTVKIRPELARFVTYCFFWTFCFLAMFVTKFWVEPMIEGGAEALGEPPERLGCGPFNRVSIFEFIQLDRQKWRFVQDRRMEV